jgi:hypothetical protein
VNPEPVPDEEDRRQKEKQSAEDFDHHVADQSILHAVISDVNVAPVKDTSDSYGKYVCM